VLDAGAAGTCVCGQKCECLCMCVFQDLRAAGTRYKSCGRVEGFCLFACVYLCMCVSVCVCV